MRVSFVCGAVSALAIVGVALAQEAKPPAPMHVVKTAADLKWGDPPPGLPPGGKVAVVFHRHLRGPWQGGSLRGAPQDAGGLQDQSALASD